jgi:hypothetical protein
MNRYVMLGAIALAGVVAAAAEPPKVPSMIPPEALAPAVPPPPAATATSSAAAKSAADAAFLEKLKEVRLIEIKHLRSTDPAEFEKGRRQILDLTDEACVGPMVSVLHGPNARYRNLLLDALKGYSARESKVARAYVQELAVGEAAVADRRRATDILKAISPTPPTDRLLVHLAIDEVPALRDHAATALATLGDKRAAWLMVERLTTEEIRAVTAEIPAPAQGYSDINATSTGVPKFRRATIQGAAGGTVISQTIDLPTGDIADIPTPGFGPTFTAVVGMQRVEVQHPEMLAALRSLTGKDFGYDKAGWTKWLNSPEGAKVVPAWKPLKLVAD